MKTWFSYIKQGLSRKVPPDGIAADQEYGGLKGNVQNLLPYFKRHWRRGMLGCLLILAASVFAFPPPLITRYLVDDVILGRQVGLLAGAIMLLVGCLIAEKLARLLEDFYFARFEQQITLDIQQDLIDRVLHFPKSFFDDKQTGYLQSRLIEDVDGIRWFFSSTIVHVVSNLLRFLGGIIFLFYLQWQLALAVLFLLPALVWLIRFFAGKIHILSHQAMEQKASVSGHVQESLSDTAHVKAYVRESHTGNQLMASIKQAFRINLEQRAINSVASLSISAMPGMARIITLAIGAIWIIKGQWTIGSLLAFQAYLAYVFGPAQFLASSNLQFQKARAALERVSALFDVVPEENHTGGRRVDHLKGAIEFRNVSFGYNGYEPVLQDISLQIHPGERVALVGPSGVGKTTLLSLILRFYRTAGGEIYFDGIPATDYNTGSLRRRIGYASQDPKIVTGTVMENLRYGALKADKDTIIQAARTAAVDSDVEKLPDKYETVIGAGGLNLSAGQKQRLSIARALVKDPDILILDEPASALDSATENSLFDALPAQVAGKTMLMASHRLSTIRHADRILVLNASGQAEIGTHESLVRTNDYYRSIATSQGLENLAAQASF